MRIHLAIFVCASLAFAGAAIANDTEAEIGIGGLTFTKSDNVEMLSEDLYVSRDQIIVKYLFRNTSGKDVESLVAFPLPEFKYSGEDERNGVSEVDFKTTVDGRSISAHEEKKAYLSGIDQTSALEAEHIPLNPDEAVEALANAGQETKHHLTTLGLLDNGGLPLWSVKTTYYWQQRFPAGRQVSIEHSYKPAIGGTVASAIGTTRWPEVRSSYDAYCVDRNFLDAAKTAHLGTANESGLAETWISYILTTGANWAAPIRDFRLVVDKGHPGNLVSFCADNIRQITPTEFEVTEKNFTPKRDLKVLIASPLKASGTVDSAAPDLSSLTCDDLWLKRNSLFKAARYCFKTSRAIATYGNAGCSFDNIDQVPLNEADRALVDAITKIEKSKGCQR